jgi:hypothetical protein
MPRVSERCAKGRSNRSPRSCSSGRPRVPRMRRRLRYTAARAPGLLFDRHRRQCSTQHRSSRSDSRVSSPTFRHHGRPRVAESAGMGTAGELDRVVRRLSKRARQPCVGAEAEPRLRMDAELRASRCLVVPPRPTHRPNRIARPVAALASVSMRALLPVLSPRAAGRRSGAILADASWRVVRSASNARATPSEFNRIAIRFCASPSTASANTHRATADSVSLVRHSTWEHWPLGSVSQPNRPSRAVTQSVQSFVL